MKYSSKDIILAFSTGLGIIGAYPKPPLMLIEFFNENQFLRWILVFILVWQGGSKQDHKLAVLITATLFALYKSLE